MACRRSIVPRPAGPTTGPVRATRPGPESDSSRHGLFLVRSPPRPPPRRQGDGLHASDAHPARLHPARDAGPGPPRLRDDGQRQDRRVRPPDPPPPHGQAARHDARADPHAHARARRADRRAPQAARRPHGDVGRGRLRRRRDGAAGARVPERRRRDRRDARPPPRPLPLPVREALRPRGPRPRRGGPDARHGVPPGHPPRAEAPAPAEPDAVLLGDDAASDRAALEGDAEGSRAW